MLQEEVLTLNVLPEMHIFSCQQDNAVSGTDMFYIGRCHSSTCLCNEKGRSPSFSEQKCQWPECNVLDLNCDGDVHTLPSVVCDLSLEHKQSLYCFLSWHIFLFVSSNISDDDTVR